MRENEFFRCQPWCKMQNSASFIYNEQKQSEANRMLGFSSYPYESRARPSYLKILQV